MLPLLIVLFGSQTSAHMHCFLFLPAVGWAGSFTGPRDNESNQAMQQTDDLLRIYKGEIRK
jgi:hypothetical protein